MRLAVISDIHGNLEAFREILTDIDSSQIDQVVCLGDNIGYGPEPETVVTLLRERRIPSVMGNHELGIVDPSTFHWFNSNAQASLLLTRKLISNDTLAFLTGLPATLVLEDCLGVHGYPPDSVTRYLFDVAEEELSALLKNLTQRLVFVGHTHDLELIIWDGLELVRRELGPGVSPLQPTQRCLVNVGSVGQPRDGNNNAKYVIWDNVENLLDVRFVSYDIAKTADKIIRLGFPRFYATRLW
jgi:predicted phosphodiesterase